MTIIKVDGKLYEEITDVAKLTAKDIGRINDLENNVIPKYEGFVVAAKAELATLKSRQVLIEKETKTNAPIN